MDLCVKYIKGNFHSPLLTEMDANEGMSLYLLKIICIMLVLHMWD